MSSAEKVITRSVESKSNIANWGWEEGVRTRRLERWEITKHVETLKTHLHLCGNKMHSKTTEFGKTNTIHSSLQAKPQGWCKSAGIPRAAQSPWVYTQPHTCGFYHCLQSPSPEGETSSIKGRQNTVLHKQCGDQVVLSKERQTGRGFEKPREERTLGFTHGVNPWHVRGYIYIHIHTGGSWVTLTKICKLGGNNGDI